jgi:hypothetical protein
LYAFESTGIDVIYDRLTDRGHNDAPIWRKRAVFACGSSPI